MRRACRTAADLLDFAGSCVEPGITTDEIDRRVHEKALSWGVYPSPLSYMGFPKSLCSSINEVVCHGIPDDRPLCEGDIVNLDVSTFVEGYHGDTSRTFHVGRVDPEAARLVAVAKQCLDDCIAVCAPGVPLNEIGRVVSETCARHGYETSAAFCGHGIGDVFHMLPYVLHYANEHDVTPLVAGQVFTIEPILCEGSQAHVTWEDGWTAATTDGGWTAQFEHTLLITQSGVEVLT